MNPGRITRRAALGGLALVGGAAVNAVVIEPSWLEVTLHEVPVDRLPSALDGFTIAQVTDAHLHTLGQVERSIIDAVRQHDVQLLALTGDLVDSTALLGALAGFLHELGTTEAQVVATLGNWEHWGKIPAEALSKTYREAGATLLVNESLDIAGGVRVFATDDSTSGRPEFNLLGHGGTQPRVLLTHSPDLLDLFPADAGHMALSLAGHTHGGQVRLGSSLVPFRPQGSGRFVAGWYRTAAGRAYVSRGTGTSILPMRFTCRPEFPIFRLRQA